MAETTNRWVRGSERRRATFEYRRGYVADMTKNAAVKVEGGTVAWRAAEYGHAAKGFSWYLSVGFGALALAGVALWQKNFFFAIFIVVAAAVLFAMSRRRPPVLDFRIDADGVTVVDRLSLPYDRLEGFATHRRTTTRQRGRGLRGRCGSSGGPRIRRRRGRVTPEYCERHRYGV